MNASRRQFLGAVFGGTALLGATRLVAQQGTDTLSGAADPLRDPTLIGAPRAPLHPLDNDPTIIGIERKLRCTCGCTLDIYTCRTTDFSCTVSPALHREIRAMHEEGRTPQQIIDFMVAREGPEMLLSHPASGFNLAGYLVPGLSILVAGLLLAAWLLRKRTPVVVATVEPSPAPPVDAAAQARLQRALDEVDS